jgi:trimeric autotransporter adhesin
MANPRFARSAAIAGAVSLAGLCGLVAGCSTRTDVSAIGNTPAFYSHIYVTAQAVWFNNSATAGPDAGGWVKFPLSTPATVDLVADSGGNFGNIITGLRLAPGTYNQIRLIPVDATQPLTASAQTLGALYNMEADYVNASGVTEQVPLQVLNPDKGIGIQASLNVPIGNIGADLGAIASSASTSTTTPDTAFGSNETATPTTSTSSTGTGLGLGTSSSTTTTIANFSFSFDGARDLTMFTYGGQTGVIYSSHASAYDLSRAGGITGQLTLTNLTGITGATGLPDIYVNAELVTPDNTRHYVVASTPVNSDGSFTLYPLAVNSSTTSPDTYDIVIHGPGIATIIVKDIQVFMTSSLNSLNSLEDEESGLGNTNDTSLFSTTPSTSTTTSTTTTSSTSLLGTSSTTNGVNVITPQNLVSIGTLIPRAATGYTANIQTSATAPLPAGAEVAFYQTLPGSGELPYVIERSPIDPINQVLATPQQLSTGTVDSGTFNNENTTAALDTDTTTDTTDTTTNTSGSLVTVVSASPKEGTGSYQVAADAPLYAYGELGTKVSMPASATSSTSTTTTAAQEVTVGPLSLASGSNPATINVEVKEATPGKYNAGEVLIGSNGQLVASASLTAVLQGGGGTVVLDKVPGGTPESLYYVTVVAWNSANPQATFTRQWSETPLNLTGTGTGSASLQLTID